MFNSKSLQDAEELDRFIDKEIERNYVNIAERFDKNELVTLVINELCDIYKKTPQEVDIENNTVSWSMEFKEESSPIHHQVEKVDFQEKKIYFRSQAMFFREIRYFLSQHDIPVNYFSYEW